MKKVLITGAGSGLGRGTAIGLAKAGHKVFATTHIWAQASDLQREAAKLDLGDQLTVNKLDVLDERDVKRTMSWDFDTFVSNAAIGESGPISEIPVDLVRRTFETNVFSNLAMAQQVVRKFIDSKTQGRIVFVSSMGGMLTAYRRSIQDPTTPDSTIAWPPRPTTGTTTPFTSRKRRTFEPISQRS